MKIAMFMGAGFSAPLGLPTMNEFLAFADASPRLDEEDLSLLGRLVLDARSANSFLQSSPTNLEDILSFAVMGDRLGIGDEDGKRPTGILRLLQRVYSHVSNSDNFWEQFDTVSNFLQPDGWKNHQFTFITTNYDLHLECAFHRMGGKSVDPGFSFVQIPGQRGGHGSLYRRGGVSVFKLHGSVNWFANPDNPESLLVEGSIVDVHASPDSEHFRNQLPLACASHYEGPGIPVLVPPSFLKPDASIPIRQIWRGAARALSMANVIVFVGYSFPPTDTEMRYFLARSLADNPGLRKIIIIDIAAERITGRLQAPGSLFGSHFRDFLVPVQRSWTNSPLEL